MIKHFWIAAAAALSLVGLGGDALAQQQPSGQWQCQHANRSATNNAFENWLYQFTLALQAEGTFNAQGNYIAQTNGFSVPFMAQGRWEQKQGGIVVNGAEQRQDGTTAQFILVFSVIGDRAMSNQLESTSGKLLTYCQR